MGEIGSWKDFKTHHLIVETYIDVDEVNRLLSGRKKNFNKENHFIVLPAGEKARDRFKNEVSRAVQIFFYFIPPLLSRWMEDLDSLEKWQNKNRH